ncbi:MAG: hypothetical protein L3J35_03710 [Bacteroidales bacterium]|nr:hypothetical protein [Bacteroidales bacterium]
MFLLEYEKRKIMLETNELDLTNENLKTAYNLLCHYESIREAKVYFDNELPEKINGRYIIKYRKIIFFNVRTKNRILIKPDKYWLLYLLHEFTHQLLVRDIGFTGHGQNFKKLNEYLITRYFDVIYKLLIDIQNEKK